MKNKYIFNKIAVLFFLGILFIMLVPIDKVTFADSLENSQTNLDENYRNNIKNVIERDKYYEIQMFSENRKVSLPKNVISYWFNIAEGTVLDDTSYVNLDLTLSETLIDNRSSISLEVNGNTLETKWFKDISDNYNCSLNVNIPKKILKVNGTNEIAIITTQRSIEGDCADIDNPNNWVTINNTSKLCIGVLKCQSPYLGNIYSCYYDNFAANKSLDTNFILPKNPDSTSIKGMLKVASAIGKSYPSNGYVNYEVSNEYIEENSSTNKIYIGSFMDVRNNKNALLPSKNLDSEEGYLSVYNKTQNAPWYKVLITGSDSKGFNKAVDFFANRGLLDNIYASQLNIKSSIESEHKQFETREDGVYTFEDFGYDSINMAGAFHKRTSYSFVQPNGVQSGANSYIKLNFKHSEILVSDRSLLTVYFNNIPAGSVKLSSANAKDGEIKVNIPEDALKEPVIKVDIECYNYLGKVDCSKDYYDSAWTVIDNSSQIYLERGENGIVPKLTNFPTLNTFSEKNNLEVVLGMPKDYDKDLLELGAILSTKAGQNAREVFDFKTYFGDEYNEINDDKYKDMIFIGSFDNISLPDKVKDSLYIVPLGNGQFKIKQNINTVSEVLKDKVIIQAIRSPWNFNKTVYVVAYDNNKINLAKKFLSNSTALSNMNDQVSVINDSMIATNYEVIDKKSEKIPFTFEKITYDVEKKIGMPWWVIIGALVVLIIGLNIIFKAKKDKKKFKNAKLEMEKINAHDDEENLNSSHKITDESIENIESENNLGEERHDNN